LAKEKRQLLTFNYGKQRKIGENEGEETQICVQGKLEENERKGDMNYKKASKKQFTTFGHYNFYQFSFGSFLPYPYTLAHLEHYSIHLDWRKQEKNKQGIGGQWKRLLDQQLQ